MRNNLRRKDEQLIKLVVTKAELIPASYYLKVKTAVAMALSL